MDSENVGPYLRQLRSAEAKLTTPGSPFAISTESVLGQAVTVFAQRRRSIGDLLKDSLSYGDAEYLVFESGRRVTFAEHYNLVERVAGSLQSRFGIGKGDRVAVCSANNLGWILTAFACARLGAVVVALNSWWTEGELRSAIELTEPALIVADEKRRDLLADWRSDLPLLFAEAVADELTLKAPLAELPDAIDEDDPWVLAFTSGTSGKPKAATLTHRSFLGFVQLNAFIGARGAIVLGQTAAPARPTVRLAVFPLFHISGLGSLIATLSFGQKTVWPEGRFDAGRVIDLTNREGITLWGGASTHLVRLLNHPDVKKVDPQQLTQVGIGGSASTPSLIALAEDRLPHTKNTFSTGYGMTECGGLATYATNILLTAAADCVGPPLPTVELKIVNDQGDPLDDGRIGTICIRSPILMTDYWRNPEANAVSMLPDRWLRTEDYGRIENGLLFVASRQRDLIIRGGENIYPIEIEDCLDGHPDVYESAVYGRDDPEFGQTVHACVVVVEDSTVTSDELLRHCSDRLAYFKVPAVLELRTRPLPRNASGKVLKRLLAEDSEHLAVGEPE